MWHMGVQAPTTLPRYACSLWSDARRPRQRLGLDARDSVHTPRRQGAVSSASRCTWEVEGFGLWLGMGLGLGLLGLPLHLGGGRVWALVRDGVGVRAPRPAAAPGRWKGLGSG